MIVQRIRETKIPIEEFRYRGLHQIQEWEELKDTHEESRCLLESNTVAITRVQSILYTRQGVKNSGCRYIANAISQMLKKQHKFTWTPGQINMLVTTRRI